ncbi:MAG: hypothetical protein KAT65_28850 [Methanophagales archaeon]|nr:hypothetical protein [Methanophagales archaeon]
MEEHNVIEIGDLRLIEGKDICTNNIQSIEDFKKLNKKIEIRIKLYRLDGLLLKIHDTSLKHEDTEKNYLDFIAGSITKYALLNSNIYNGLFPIYDEEFYDLICMITECSIYDPEFEKERELMVDQEERAASILLRKFGSQARWDIRLHNMLGRTIFFYDELIKNDKTPTFIKELVNHKFEEKFGLTLLDFIKIGFLLFAQSKQSRGTNREFFENGRIQNMSIPSDEIVKKCLDQVACDPYQFKKICEEEELMEGDLRAYEFNPLFEYPIIRLWKGSNQEKSKDDKYIAPVPNLVLYRFTTGLYYQLFNTFDKEKFSTAFGDLFELYVGKLLEWCKLSSKVLTENDIEKYLPKYKGKKPDYVVFCDEGVILIECKATKYTQDMYEHGLKAEAKSCIDQIAKAIEQMNEFETQIPSISEECGINYTDLKVQKVIVSFENLLGLKEGPFRNWIDRKRRGEGIKTDWQILWVWYFEEIQPYITKGANFWSSLIDIDKKRFDKIIEEMKSKTGASYSDSVLFKYQENFFNELTKNVRF